ncbi:MAG TPA: GTPase Era [Acidobacteriota bacterium]
MKSGFASIVGRPNVGKSTLLNRLVGQKVAIVSNKPQTTRNRIIGVVHHPEGQVVFVDTPGIHKPLHPMNERMVRVAQDALANIDLVLLMADATQPFGRGDAFVLELLQRARSSAFLLLNKIDRVAKPKLLPMLEHYQKLYPFEEFFPLSALSGDNVEALMNAVLARMPEGQPLFDPDQVTDQPERHLAAELVREQLLHRTHEELPYALGVIVEQWAESERGIRIDATILVEREGQKGIVIGAGGSLLRDAGTAARLELEQLLGCKVVLKLWVKVKEHWRRDGWLLDQMRI